MNNQPIELIEASVPMEISRYGLVENSGGPGRSRGGYALVREYKVLSDEATLHVRSDRRAILSIEFSLLDVSDMPDAEVGTEAVVLGRQGDEEITPEEISETVGVPAIELIARLAHNTRRVYV